MPDLTRMKNAAELLAGRRDGTHVYYRPFDPEEWTGDNEKYKPTELFTRDESHEISRTPKDVAADLLWLIDHVRENAEVLDDLIDAMPVHDVPGQVLKATIKSTIRTLSEGTPE